MVLKVNRKLYDQLEVKYRRRWEGLLKKAYWELVAPLKKYGDFDRAISYTFIPRRETYQPLLSAMTEEVMLAFYRDMQKQFRKQVQKDGNIGLAFIQEYLLEHVGEIAGLIDETTRNLIRANLVDMVAQKISVKQAGLIFADMIPGLCVSRATAIVRTELTGAANYASMKFVDGIGTPYTKIWASGRDRRVRPTHQKANGQRVKEGELFQVGNSKLRFPGDPRGAADEIVRCRCTTLFEITDEDLGL